MQAQVATDIHLHIIHETTTETLQELSPCTLGHKREVDVVFAWRDVAFHEGASIARFLRLVSMSIDVNLLLLLVPSNIGEKGAHAPILEGEAVHTDVSVRIGIVER